MLPKILRTQSVRGLRKTSLTPVTRAKRREKRRAREVRAKATSCQLQRSPARCPSAPIEAKANAPQSIDR